MSEQHPMTPPDEMLQRLGNDWPGLKEALTQAARWGADMELEACCEWLDIPNNRRDGWLMPGRLRAARRPKPPSLKELALKVLPAQTPGLSTTVTLHPDDIALVRRALEELPDD